MRYLAALAIVFSLTVPALAEQYGPLGFTVPSGWSIVRKARDDGKLDLRGPGGAMITITVRRTAASALELARASVPAEASQELKQVAIRVTGQAGHLVVRRSATDSYASAACLPGRGQGAAVVLRAPHARYKDCLNAWGGIVDNGRLAVLAEGSRMTPPAAAPAPVARPAPPPPPPPPAVTKHWVELRNVVDWGTATVYWDGQAYRLAPGEGRKIEATAGVHAFKWQNADGSWGEGRFEVPRFNVFKGACPKPAAPAAPAAPAQPPASLTDAEALDLAQWWTALVLLSTQTVKTMDEPIGDDIVRDAMDPSSPSIKNLVTQVKTRPEFRDFCAAIQREWNDIVAVARDRTHERHYQMKRDMMAFLHRESPQTYPIPPDDGLGGDGIDRLLRQQRRKWDEIRAMRDRNRRQQMINDQMSMGMMMNMMQMQHQTSMNIINNMR